MPLRAALHDYLASGWAFLVPYVVTYALYAWGGWSVIPGQQPGVALLHIFWVLHLVHAVVLLDLLRERVRARRDSAAAAPAGWAWLALALLFFISGAYLEFPADPWTHYARVNEWHSRALIADHSAGLKASYFLAYSLFGFWHDQRWELIALDVFHAGGCLLLAWQYFRLGRATGLAPAPACLFALLTTVCLGNNLFGFYRYYGISSSVIAQIAFVACLRSALGWARAWAHHQPAARDRSSLVRTTLTIGGTLLLAAFNHAQVLAFIALALSAVFGWACCERYGPRALAWMGAAVLAACISAWVWWRPDATAASWLTFWGGFAIMKPNSPASARTVEILGLIGMIHVVAGALLLRRNHIAGWLTVFPLLMLSLPCVALPLVGLLEPTGSLPMFHRVLLAIPVPLALICFAEQLRRRLDGAWRLDLWRTHGAFAALLLGTVWLTAAPASRPFFNRFFNSTERSNVGTAWQAIDADLSTELRALPPDQQLFGAPNALFLSDAFGLTRLLHTTRDFTPSRRTEEVAMMVGHVHDFTPKLRLLLVKPTAPATSASYAGHLSRHWPAQALSLESAAYIELLQLAADQRGEAQGSGPMEMIRFDRR